MSHHPLRDQLTKTELMAKRLQPPALLQRFGRLKVIVQNVRHQGRSCSVCICDCGAVKTVRIELLKSTSVVSCGCAKRERAAALGREKRRHGMSLSPEYRIWKGLIARCCRKTNSAFPNYGGRGIKICKRWQNSFEAFYADMGCRPSPELTIDRIDNNGDYEPLNCRWATPQDQARNRRSTRLLTFQDETLCLAAWADRTGISGTLISQRLANGWSVERALTTRPVAKRRRTNM